MLRGKNVVGFLSIIDVDYISDKVAQIKHGNKTISCFSRGKLWLS